MKVLHLIDSGGLYGAEVMLLNLVAEQVRQGLEPVICSMGEKQIAEKPFEAAAAERGFAIRKFRMRAGFNIAGALEILKFAHDQRADILHSHGYKGDILFGFLPKRFRRIPLVTTLHGWTSTGSLNRMKIYEWLDAASLKFMDAVVIVSKGMLSHRKLRNMRLRNLSIVENGMPRPDFAGNVRIPGDRLQTPALNGPLDQDIIDFCRDGFVVGAIGRLSPEKGFSCLLEAASRLMNDTVRDLKIVIIGEGRERTALETLARALNLENKVLFAGYRSHANRYLPCFKAFVLPSFTEGLPITVLEAMQSGTPVIATTVGGIPEALAYGEAGLLVKPGDCNELAKAIRSFHEDPFYAKQLAAQAQTRAFTRYSSEQMALGYSKIYQSIRALAGTGTEREASLRGAK